MGTTRDVREAVEAELAFDPLVDATDITVKNLRGDVALNGTVPSYPQYVEAAAAAQRVAGVKNVHNHLAVVLSAHVRTWAEHDAVTDAAWMTAGVYDVEDDLEVTG